MKKIIVILAIVALWNGVGQAQIGMPPIETICFDNLESFNEIPCPPPKPCPYRVKIVSMRGIDMWLDNEWEPVGMRNPNQWDMTTGDAIFVLIRKRICKGDKP